jgi:hypothetical protein
MEVFEQVLDPRARRGVRHPCAGLVAAGIAAVSTGARSFAAIAEWVADQDPVTLSGFGLTRSEPPSEPTLRRILTALDAEVLDRVLGAWMWTRTTTTAGRRVIAIDGKTVRGARTRRVPDGEPGDGVTSCRRTTLAPHLVAAYDHDIGTVLRQVAVAAKSNEIPAVQRLLEPFDLAGVVVTVDAMHTQTGTADQILTAGGD